MRAREVSRRPSSPLAPTTPSHASGLVTRAACVKYPLRNLPLPVQAKGRGAGSHWHGCPLSSRWNHRRKCSCAHASEGACEARDPYRLECLDPISTTYFARPNQRHQVVWAYPSSSQRLWRLRRVQMSCL
eukprot:scaffold31926_cov32-Tisochrysis_lutea.AAC.2